MYLTKLKIDNRRNTAKKALVNASLMHSMIRTSLHGSEERILWNVEYLPSGCYLLIVSAKMPDSNILNNQLGFERQRVLSLNYGTYISSLESGLYQFSLDINPVIRNPELGIVKENNGVVCPKRQVISRFDDVMEYLGYLGRKNGFEILSSPVKWKKNVEKISRDAQDHTIVSFKIDGFLKITDVNLFQDVLAYGLGRGRAFGHGMMLVLPAKWSRMTDWQ